MKKCVLFLLSLMFVGCITTGSAGLRLPDGWMRKSSNYEKIRKIVIEEARNNGFSNLTSEIKPTKYNDYKGKLYFLLKTNRGQDQLVVDFDKDTIMMQGAGTRSNPDSAIKAIKDRIRNLS